MPWRPLRSSFEDSEGTSLDRQMGCMSAEWLSVSTTNDSMEFAEITEFKATSFHEPSCGILLSLQSREGVVAKTIRFVKPADLRRSPV